MTDQGAPQQPAPPPLHLELPINSPMPAVIKAEEHFLGAIVEVGGEVAQRPNPVRWLLQEATTNGAIRFKLAATPERPDIAQSLMPAVVAAVTSGFTQLERSADRPGFFNDTALEKVAALSELTESIGPMRVVNGTASVAVTAGAGDHVRSLLGASYSAEGSVEGFLLGVNLHDRRQFSIYDTLTNRRIRCEFGDRIPLELVAQALSRGARVTVYGTIDYRTDDEIRAVRADELVIFPPDADIPTADDVRGLLG